MCLCWVSSDSLPLFFLEWSHEFVYPRVSSTAGHALNSLDLFSSLLVWLICVWDCRCAAPIGAVFQSRWSSAGCLSGMSSKPCPEIVWESTHKGLGEKRTGTILMRKYSWWGFDVCAIIQSNFPSMLMQSKGSVLPSTPEKYAVVVGFATAFWLVTAKITYCVCVGELPWG